MPKYTFDTEHPVNTNFEGYSKDDRLAIMRLPVNKNGEWLEHPLSCLCIASTTSLRTSVNWLFDGFRWKGWSYQKGVQLCWTPDRGRRTLLAGIHQRHPSGKPGRVCSKYVSRITKSHHSAQILVYMRGVDITRRVTLSHFCYSNTAERTREGATATNQPAGDRPSCR